MSRRLLPPHCRRRPISTLISPDTDDAIREIARTADGRWSRGAILDRAVQIAMDALMVEAESMQIYVIAGPATASRLGIAHDE